ncbi:MAG: hypothetical protein ACRBDI_08450 [Alphaproteobacteria bacterium]
MTMLSGIFGNNKNKKTPLISPDEARILKQSELLEDLRALLRPHAYSTEIKNYDHSKKNNSWTGLLKDFKSTLKNLHNNPSAKSYIGTYNGLRQRSEFELINHIDSEIKKCNAQNLRSQFKYILRLADALDETENLYLNGEHSAKPTIYTGNERKFSYLEKPRETRTFGVKSVYVTPDDLDKSRIDASLKTLSENFDVQFPKFISSFDELMQLAQDKAIKYEEAHDFSTKLMTRIME